MQEITTYAIYSHQTNSWYGNFVAGSPEEAFAKLIEQNRPEQDGPATPAEIAEVLEDKYAVERAHLCPESLVVTIWGEPAEDQEIEELIALACSDDAEPGDYKFDQARCDATSDGEGYAFALEIDCY